MCSLKISMLNGQMFPSIFTVKLSNCEHLKNFRNVDCVLANQYKVQDYYASKPQNHKLITVAVCGLVNSHLIGLFLETQWHSINVSGVHAFVSFTVRVIWNSQNRAGATYFPQLLPTWPQPCLNRVAECIKKEFLVLFVLGASRGMFPQKILKFLKTLKICIFQSSG